MAKRKGVKGKRRPPVKKEKRTKRPKPMTPVRHKRKPVRHVTWETLSIRQAAAVIGNHLMNEGIRPILIGPACAAVYAPAIKTLHIDFVIPKYHIEKVEIIMRELAFKSSELRSFVSKDAPFEINFNAPPVVVGDEPVERVEELRSKEGVVRLLSPTDCVRHRLAAWYRWGDEVALEQAIAVARRHPIDRPLIKRWSEWEWSNDKYEEFLKAL